MKTKHVKNAWLLPAVAALLCLAAASQAGNIEIETVKVGDPGNAPDDTGCGAVAYTYAIGKYEVTAGQYTAFLNAVAAEDTHGLYNADMAGRESGCGISRSGSPGEFSYAVDPAFVNRPVNYVSFFDACRFANWLSNGQPTGAQDYTTTEEGTYDMRESGMVRSPDWKWAVTSDNEWYKAAFYHGGGKDEGYWLYPTRSDTPPGNDRDDVYGNNANWNPEAPEDPIWTTPAGQFKESQSPCGTFDQAGNVWEWIDDVVAAPTAELGPPRRTRGGSCFDQNGTGFLRKDAPRDYWDGGWEHPLIGFRISRSVP